MAHNVKMSNAAVDAEGDALAPLFDNGWLRLYDNTGAAGMPADADASLGTKVVLAELRFAATGIATSVNGLLTANALTSDTSANASGDAYMYRCFKADGTTPICQGTCGITGGGFDLELPNVTIGIATTVGVTSFTHTIPK